MTAAFTRRATAHEPRYQALLARMGLPENLRR